VNWYLGVLSKYADFSGRARRMEYWMFTLVILIVIVCLAVITGLLSMGHGVHSVLVLVYSLAVFIPSLAVGVRRLHDTGRSGWYLLITIIPLIGWLILLYFQLQEGERHANEYGPDPKA
jgi:uncharacterized membrane protein YhaH (DUF805 family)